MGGCDTYHQEEEAGIITGSDQILKDYAKKASWEAKEIEALIEDVFHTPNFNADDVDTDMLKRFADSIDMHQEGGGAQKLELFKLPAERSCVNSSGTFGRLVVSTLPSRSTWILMETHLDL